MSNLEGIYELTQSFLTPLSLDETFQIIDKQAKELLQAEYSSILLYQNNQLERVFASCEPLMHAKVRKNGRTYFAFRSGKPFTVSVKSAKDIRPKGLYDMRIRSIIFIPLVFQKKSMGVLNVLSRGSYNFADHDLLNLKIFGAMVSLSIHCAQLNEENGKALELRDLFFAAASHELKTPVTTIKLYGQMLKKTLEQGKLPNYQWATVILREIERITRLTNQFLIVNRIKTGHMYYDLKRRSLRNVIRQVIIEFNASHKHNIIYKDKIQHKRTDIWLDDHKLTEAIGNILDNAAKYSPDKKTIFLTLSYKTPNFIVAIRDQGQGINKQELSKIFSVFVKGTSTVKEGIGMGLYLTKAIIEGHHGTIRMQSTLHKGTTVKILLPENKRKASDVFRGFSKTASKAT